MSDKQHSSAPAGDTPPGTTHFGFQQVAETDKARKVAEVFHSVAARYDVMNDLMSGGMHRAGRYSPWPAPACARA